MIRRSRKSNRGSKQGKHQSKQKHTESTRVDGDEGRSFTHTSPTERKTIFALRRQGLGVHPIAKRVGRSSRTVYQVLTGYGTRPMPEPGGPPGAGRQDQRDSGGRSRRRRRRRSSGEAGRQDDLAGSLLRKVQPRIIESFSQHLKDHPDVALQLGAAYLGVKIPEKSLDYVILDEIRANPGLRRQWAVDFLESQRRRGRTDADIAGEVLDLACKIAERMVRGQWPEVVKSAITSGEFRKTVEAVVRGRPASASGTAVSTAPQGLASTSDRSSPMTTLQRWPKLSREAATRILSTLPLPSEVRDILSSKDRTEAESREDPPPGDQNASRVGPMPQVDKHLRARPHEACREDSQCALHHKQKRPSVVQPDPRSAGGGIHRACTAPGASR